MKFLTFGEILFDVFPDRRTLGGAPLNVAAHMFKLGNDGIVVSSLGDDELGQEARKQITVLGLPLSFIKTSRYPTGRADIQMKGKNADYTFNEPCAWDDITLGHPLEKAYDLVYFGSLAQRSMTSRNTLSSILSSVHARVVFFDVNIRKHFYTKEILEEGMKRATILKVNDEELPLIASLCGSTAADEDSRVLFLMDTYHLSMVLLSKGKRGSSCYENGKRIDQACGDVVVVDTVGAGDSLSAGFLSSYLNGGNAEQALKIGSTLADYVCAHHGAIPAYDGQIARFLGEQGIVVR